MFVMNSNATVFLARCGGDCPHVCVYRVLNINFLTKQAKISMMLLYSNRLSLPLFATFTQQVVDRLTFLSTRMTEKTVSIVVCTRLYDICSYRLITWRLVARAEIPVLLTGPGWDFSQPSDKILQKRSLRVREESSAQFELVGLKISASWQGWKIRCSRTNNFNTSRKDNWHMWEDANCQNNQDYRKITV